MIYGCTGTSKGCTVPQLKTMRLLLTSLGSAHTLVHGDCKEADEAFANIASSLGWLTESRPSNMSRTRAFHKSTVVCEPKQPLDRNHDIVAQGVHGIFAAPKGFSEELRSGTWATVRYARKAGRHIWFIWPDGKMTEEN